jgi:hypothetical protein
MIGLLLLLKTARMMMMPPCPLGFSREELEDLGQQASEEAIAALKGKGIPITMIKDGTVYLQHEDGTLEPLDLGHPE